MCFFIVLLPPLLEKRQAREPVVVASLPAALSPDCPETRLSDMKHRERMLPRSKSQDVEKPLGSALHACHRAVTLLHILGSWLLSGTSHGMRE
jgi:hypothetical protein